MAAGRIRPSRRVASRPGTEEIGCQSSRSFQCEVPPLARSGRQPSAVACTRISKTHRQLGESREVPHETEVNRQRRAESQFSWDIPQSEQPKTTMLPG